MGGAHSPGAGNSQAEIAEFERLASRYSREAQLAIEGALYWALRWPFELMATLVQAGRKWEEDYSRTMRRRRVSLCAARATRASRRRDHTRDR